MISFLRPHSAFLPAALTFAHLSLAAATSLALVAGLLRRSFFLDGLALAIPFPFTRAHLARCAGAIAARAARDMRQRRLFGACSINGVGIPVRRQQRLNSVAL
jgi:hypothetical protein